MERKGHMVGVVVSWDPEMRAPQQWVDRMYANSEVRDSLTGKHLLLFWSPLCRYTLLVPVSICLHMQGIKAENTPHYKVLFSGPGPSSLVIGYLPQTQLERITGMRVC